MTQNPPDERQPTTPQPSLDMAHVIDGIAGARTIVAHYKYPGEPPQQAVFTGSVYGTPGPIHLSVGGFNLHVDQPDRFGEAFDKAWVEKFYDQVGDATGTIDAEHAYLETGNQVGAHRSRENSKPKPNMSFSTFDDERAELNGLREENHNYNRDGL